MPSHNSLHPFQKDILNLLTDRIENNDPRTVISLPPGTGKTFLIWSFLNRYFRTMEETAKVLVLTPTRSLQEQMLSVLKENLIVSAGTADQIDFIRVVVDKDSQKGSLGDVKILAFKLIICVDLNEDSCARLMGSQHTGLPPVIVFTRFPYSKNERIGDAHYVYGFSDAIRDGLYRPFNILKVDFSKNEAEEEAYKTLALDTVDISEKPVNGAIIPAAYLRLVCADLIGRVGDEKTVVISPNIAYAEALVDTINNGNDQDAVARCIHSNQSPNEIQRTTVNFEDPGSDLSILVIVEMSALIGKSRNVNHVVSLRKNSDILIRTLGAILGNSRGTKTPLHLYDYIGISDALTEFLNEDFTVDIIEEVKIPREILSETPIIFRDRKNIDPVLGAEDLAQELAEIIRIIPGEQGSMIGVFGNWGRGKTFLMDLVWKELKKPSSFTRIDFHAWKYQDTPATWAYLYERFAEAYFNRGDSQWYCPKWLLKELRKFRLNMLREGFLPIAKLIAAGALGLISLPLVNDALKDIWVDSGLIKWFSTVSIYVFGAWTALKKDYSAKAKDVFLKYASKHSFKDHLGLQAEIQKEMLKLVKCWIPKRQIGKKKIVLFVDDIDRCIEAKVIQIIDALRVLLEDVGIADRVVVVAAIDDRFLRLAIKSKYAQLMAMEKKDPQQAALDLEKVTSEYMDKLFIAGIKLGSLSRHDRDEFMLSLTKEDRSTVEKPRVLEEIIEDEQRIIDSRMSTNLRDILIQDAIERQQEGDFNQDLYLDDGDDYIEDYHLEYLDRSEQIDPSKIVRDKGILAKEEVEILRYAAMSFGDVTPRQMRIFYYRYLMAKNLVARRYFTLQRNNIWIRTRYSLIVARLIIYYSGHQVQPMPKNGEATQEVNLPLTMQKELDKAVLNGQQMVPISPLHKVMVNAFDYAELLKILDVVIAY